MEVVLVALYAGDVHSYFNYVGINAIHSGAEGFVEHEPYSTVTESLRKPCDGCHNRSVICDLRLRKALVLHQDYAHFGSPGKTRGPQSPLS